MMKIGTRLLTPMQARFSRTPAPLDLTGMSTVDKVAKFKSQEKLSFEDRARLLLDISQKAEAGDLVALTAQVQILQETNLRRLAGQCAVHLLRQAVRDDETAMVNNNYQDSKLLKLPLFLFGFQSAGTIGSISHALREFKSRADVDAMGAVLDNEGDPDLIESFRKRIEDRVNVFGNVLRLQEHVDSILRTYIPTYQQEPEVRQEDIHFVAGEEKTQTVSESTPPPDSNQTSDAPEPDTTSPSTASSSASGIASGKTGVSGSQTRVEETAPTTAPPIFLATQLPIDSSDAPSSEFTKVTVRRKEKKRSEKGGWFGRLLQRVRGSSQGGSEKPGIGARIRAWFRGSGGGSWPTPSKFSTWASALWQKLGSLFRAGN